jgi:hypothetical protein
MYPAGILAAPLQYLLKRSKLQAARCYETLASALTSNCHVSESQLVARSVACKMTLCMFIIQDWHDPPAVLKLLLRCLHHLLCADSTPSAPAAALGSGAPSSKRKRETSPGGDGGVENANVGQAVTTAAVKANTGEAQLAEELNVLDAAGRALVILCGRTTRWAPPFCFLTPKCFMLLFSAVRSNVEAVTAVTVSMGRTAPKSNSKAHGGTDAAVTADRTSLETILQRLLQSCDGFSTDSGMPATDYLGIRKVYIAATDLAQLYGSAAGVAPTAHVDTDNNNAMDGDDPDTDNNKTSVRRGLFAAAVRIGVRGSGATDIPLSCEEVFSHIAQLQNALQCVTRAHDLETRIREQRAETFQSTDDSNTFTAASCTSQIVEMWQTCVVGLVRALFAELAPVTETSPERSGKSFVGTPGLAIAAASVEVPQVAQEDLFGARGRPTPSLFAYSSQLSQPFQSRYRTKQSPVLPTAAALQAHRQDAVGAGEPPSHPLPVDSFAGSQLVLCSSHPPAVQATMDLCGAMIKVSQSSRRFLHPDGDFLLSVLQMWVEVWMDSALSTAMCVERGLLVGSLWWFLHRTSCFGVEVRAEDLALLYGAVETLQPGLWPARCPDNAVSASFFPCSKTCAVLLLVKMYSNATVYSVYP